jgi:hypothetical protein
MKMIIRIVRPAKFQLAQGLTTRDLWSAYGPRYPYVMPEGASGHLKNFHVWDCKRKINKAHNVRIM